MKPDEAATSRMGRNESVVPYSAMPSSLECEPGEVRWALRVHLPRPPAVAGRWARSIQRVVGWLDAADPVRSARRAAWAVGCLVFVIGWPHVPAGIFVCDPGDIQIACATLGTAHSPGYVGYAAVGWLLT